MPTKKLEAEPTWITVKPCSHPDHRPPSHIVLKPGWYEHTCAGCGAVTTFNVPEGARFG